MPESRVVLITGASAGFGKRAAELLSARGWRVFGTSRRPELAEARGFDMLPLDVTSEESVRACVAEVIRRAGRLDALVNNAGQMIIAAVEEAGPEQVRGLVETNVLGVVRMDQAVLPIMRKQGGGRIVTIGSIAGLIGLPFSALYCATKFALEGYVAGLRSEVAGFGIRVSLVEPGTFKTRLQEAMPPPAHPMVEYEAARSRAARLSLDRAERGSDPAQVAALIVRILESPRPRLRYRIGPGAIAIPLALKLLPDGLREKLIQRYFRIGAGG
jgi:NAD(P)-dependent dehydrogenase (short-subunit alcohol dehydrogenase family)